MTEFKFTLTKFTSQLTKESFDYLDSKNENDLRYILYLMYIYEFGSKSWNLNKDSLNDYEWEIIINLKEKIKNE